MKKIICIFSILVLCLSICACSSARSNYASVVPDEAQTLDFSSSVTVVNSPTPVITSDVVYTPVSTVEPTPTSTPTPTPTSTIVVVNTTTNYNSNPITKSPYDDYVEIGGTVKFVARASNYTSLSWWIKSSDGTVVTVASNAPSTYPGLIVSGQNSTTLVLSNVPASMDGCLIQCVFTLNGNNYYTNNAVLGVINATAAPFDNIYTYASSCRDHFASLASTCGYSTGSITNYSSSGERASFNIDFTGSSFLVRGEFFATSSGYGLSHVYVYDITGTTYKNDASISTDSEFINILNSPVPAD